MMTMHEHTHESAAADERPSGSDRARSIAMAASTAALVLIPTLGPVVAGTHEDVEEYDTDITPPDYAFAIWAPIFAAAAANAAQQLTRQTAPVNRRTGWWLTGAHALDAAWSVAPQSGRFRATPAILQTAAALTAVGYVRAQRESVGRERLVSHSAGLLLGWTSVASVVNVFAAQRGRSLASITRIGRQAARGTILAAASGLVVMIARSRHGHVSLAATSAWAFLTNAANRERTKGSRAVNAVAGGAIVATSIVTLLRGRAARSAPDAQAQAAEHASTAPAASAESAGGDQA